MVFQSNSVEAVGQSNHSLAQKSSFAFGPPLFIKVELQLSILTTKMGNCVSPAAAVPVAVPVPDEKDKIIVNLKLDLMWQRLELEQKCKSLKLKCQSLAMELERSEDEYCE